MEITIKSDWKDLTMGEFIELEQILKADIPESYRTVHVLSLLSNHTIDELESLPMHEFKSLTKNLNFINTEPKYNDIKSVYMINEKPYELKSDIASITTAQYMDYQVYMKENPVDMIKVLSCFLIPKGHNYNDGYNMQDVMKDVSFLPLEDGLGIGFFLVKQLVTYILILKDYLEKNLKELKMNKEQTTELITHLDSMASSLWYLQFAKRQ